MLDQPKTRGEQLADECVYRHLQGSAHCVGVAFRDHGQAFACDRSIDVAEGLKTVIASIIDYACADAIREYADMHSRAVEHSRATSSPAPKTRGQEIAEGSVRYNGNLKPFEKWLGDIIDSQRAKAVQEYVDSHSRAVEAAAGGPRPLADVLARMIAEIPGPDEGLKRKLGFVLAEVGRHAPEESQTLWSRAGSYMRDSIPFSVPESWTDWQRRVVEIFTGGDAGKELGK